MIKYPFICKAKMNKLLYFAVSGRVNQSYVADHTKGFKIYLHEKGEFWPGMEMENIGQTKPIYVPTKTEVRGTFKVVQKINLDKESDHCMEDTGYSYTKCMKDYVATTSGCHLDWVETKNSGIHNHPCVTRDQVLRYQITLTKINKLSWMELVKVTGCHAKCTYREYNFEKVT